MQEFIKNYLDQLQSILSKINVDIVARIINELEKVHQNSAKIYIIGNGGSSATASHMANDLGVGLKLRNIRSFDVESLSDNSSVCTAIANDIGYENIFYAQIKDKITSNDLLIAISCSGNSKNILKAVKYAKNQKATTIGFTGFEGGKLKDICKINYHIQTQKGEYGLVEDAHMIIDHIIYSYYVSTKPESKTKYTLD